MWGPPGLRSLLFMVPAGLICAGSLVGNSAILAVVLLKSAFFAPRLCRRGQLLRREMRSVTNTLIAASAMAELLVTLTSFWLTPLHYWDKQWHFGPLSPRLLSVPWSGREGWQAGACATPSTSSGAGA